MREWKFMRHVLDGIHVGSNTPTSLLARINRRWARNQGRLECFSYAAYAQRGSWKNAGPGLAVKRTFIENRVEYRVTPLALVILEADVV